MMYVTYFIMYSEVKLNALFTKCMVIFNNNMYRVWVLLAIYRQVF